MAPSPRCSRRIGSRRAGRDYAAQGVALLASWEPTAWFGSTCSVRLLLNWFVCAALLGPGCTAMSPSAPTRPEGPSEAGEAHGFVRSCESSVFGDLGAGWRRDAVIAGPAAFLARGYEDDSKRLFRTRPGRATAFKVLLVIAGDRPITVSVRTPGTALFYNPSKWASPDASPRRRKHHHGPPPGPFPRPRG